MSLPTPRDSGTHRGDGFDVCLATKVHAADIARIYNHYIDAGESTFDDSPWTPDQIAKLIHVETPQAWFVAIRQQQVVGWASVRRYSLRHGYRFTCETAIYLDTAVLGCGIGDALQRHLEEHCRKHGIHHAVAKVNSNNGRSLAFHQRHGYELVGVQKEVGHMGGRWVDVAILQKIF